MSGDRNWGWWDLFSDRAKRARKAHPRGAAVTTNKTDAPGVGLFVTLWPEMPHFLNFKYDSRIQGIRLNPAMLSVADVTRELSNLTGSADVGAPLHFDVKGRQLRIEQVIPAKGHLRLRLNHRIQVDTPTEVLFKTGNDSALLVELADDDKGQVLVFAPGAQHGPEYHVKPGESLHIRNDSLRVDDKQLFSDIELSKIKVARAHGITRWFLSYVEEQSDVDRLRELVGKDDLILLKIESQEGMRFVREEYQPQDNVRLVAACGDLYVEMEEPHHTLTALQDIIKADPNAMAASRMMLTITQNVRRFGIGTPDLADFAHLAWLKSIGYRTFMLCDEICLDDKLLNPAVGAFTAWKELP